jgi:hypothetical protein
LTDDAGKHAGEHVPDQRLLRGRKELDHAADRLRRIERVQSREDEVACLGRLQSGLGRLGVAQLADEDHIGVLPHRAAEGLLERDRVEADLALVDDRLLVAMQDLDRVLDRDDVLPTRAVDVVDDRRERGRFPGAGRAGDEDESAPLFGEPPHARREAQLVEGRHLVGNRAEGERRCAALPEPVDAKAREAFGRIGEVELPRHLELTEAAGDARCDGVEDGLEVARGERWRVEALDRAVAPDDRRLAELQVHVARADLDGVQEQAIQVHGWA